MKEQKNNKMVYEQLSAVAIIPARGGSKRFLHKNITLFQGKPLIAWTIESAIKANCFDAIVVTSDDEDILAVASTYQNQGVIAQFRPKQLAKDTATTAQTISYVIETLEQTGKIFDVCCELLPTCPLRSPEDINKAMTLLDNKVDSVISMKASPCIPDFIFSSNEEQKAKVFMSNSKILSGVTRSQDYPTLYYPNGAIYLGWVSAYKKNLGFYTNNFKIYAMPDYRSVDIDIEEDLILAQAYWSAYVDKEKS